MNSYYIGVKASGQTVFAAPERPLNRANGYAFTIGPFKSERAAKTDAKRNEALHLGMAAHIVKGAI